MAGKEQCRKRMTCPIFAKRIANAAAITDSACLVWEGMRMELKGKVAIVAGGATLIGAQAGAALAAQGAAVVLADIDQAGGDKWAAELGAAHGGRVRFRRTDVTKDADIAACLAEAQAREGGVDLLVYVAATYLDNGLASTREEWHQALDVNLVGMAQFVQQAAPCMEQRGGGAVVLFGSISGKIAQPGRMLYSVSKAAILGFTRNAALALASKNIRVNSVSPGWTWSNVISQLSGGDRPKADKLAGTLHPLGRLGGPEEVGEVVAFLCSDRARFVTGTDVAVDGGYSAIGPERMEDLIPQLMG